MESERQYSVHRTQTWTALVLGMIGVSFGSIMVKWLDAVPALVIAAWRMIFASLIVVPWALVVSKPTSHAIPRGACVLSGAILAGHFALWISSLKFTTVASSVVLVSTSPALITLYERVVSKRRISPGGWLGTALAIFGAAVIGWGDLELGSDVLVGDLMAFGGAVLVAGYWISGGRARATLSTLQYASLTYPVAAFFLILIALMGPGPMIDHNPREFGVLLLSALVPQLLGHASFSFALKRSGAALVSLASVSEPIGATLLAALLLGEELGFRVILGGLLIVFGIFLGILSASRGESA